MSALVDRRLLGQMEPRLLWCDQSRDQGRETRLFILASGVDTGNRELGSGIEGGGKARLGEKGKALVRIYRPVGPRGVCSVAHPFFI